MEAAGGPFAALAQHVEGEVFTDPFSRGQYATDASIYQVMPEGILIPKSVEDVHSALEFAKSEGHSILARGGGTSQCGQTVNSSLVIDNSKYLNKILSLDTDGLSCTVQPGLVLDELNRVLKPHGLWFPVDVSTSSRATIGGMAANNSCGGQSLKYGTMRHNVLAIKSILSDGTELHFQNGGIEGDKVGLQQFLQDLGAREAAEIKDRFPRVLRRVGGYNIDALVPADDPINYSHLLVGSEGTLAYFSEIDLKLSRLPGEKVLGICHFPTFSDAMRAAKDLVELKPQSVELVDDTMIELARGIPVFRETVDAFVRGAPAALLLVEFAEGDAALNQKRLKALEDLMGDLGYAFGKPGAKDGGCVAVTDAIAQAKISEFRKAGLNIMMSMKEAGKPVSFVEDCAVGLDDLDAYTSGLTQIFTRHGTRGTWYAHASVGCLHVRPVLNLKLDQDVHAMRSIAEECFELVKKYKGSHSGEHGDGIVRSEFHEMMFGQRMVKSFEEVKTRFDPQNMLNPNRIVSPPKMDDRSLFRYGPNYNEAVPETAFDWSAWPGKGGFQGAVEMCNNNGACRKLQAGVMCPSFRVTRDEKHVVRGRANSLRLALSGQLGADALTSDEMLESLKLCVSCKACKRECPTGVDMARMKAEVLAARRKKKGMRITDRLIGYLPRYAPYASKARWSARLPQSVPGGGALFEAMTGFSRARPLPDWSKSPFKTSEYQDENPDVVLFADVFNRYFEPENLRAACRLVRSAGLKVQVARPLEGGRDLDCGRSLIAVGALDEARLEAERVVAALLPHVEAGRMIIGLEPSSLLTLRDEFPALLPGEASARVAGAAQLFEAFFLSSPAMLELRFRPAHSAILIHGHCHQKAHAEMPAVLDVLSRIPGTDVSQIETSCCGMAGAFGYQKETAEMSLKMGELSLFPAIREAPDCILVADGFSCRHQIFHGTKRDAVHVARLLETLGSD